MTLLGCNSPMSSGTTTRADCSEPGELLLNDSLKYNRDSMRVQSLHVDW
jgi:hypothetical protein